MSENLIAPGDVFVDDRGMLFFMNNLPFETIKRMYFVVNHQPCFVRAWHGHRYETKYVTAVSGACMIAIAPLEAFNDPDGYKQVKKFFLSEYKPCILHIPAGYANGFKTLSTNSKVLFLSTSTLEESMKDDIRFDANIWKDVWAIKER